MAALQKPSPTVKTDAPGDAASNSAPSNDQAKVKVNKAANQLLGFGIILALLGGGWWLLGGKPSQPQKAKLLHSNEISKIHGSESDVKALLGPPDAHMSSTHSNYVNASDWIYRERCFDSVTEKPGTLTVTFHGLDVEDARCN